MAPKNLFPAEFNEDIDPESDSCDSAKTIKRTHKVKSSFRLATNRIYTSDSGGAFCSEDKSLTRDLNGAELKKPKVLNQILWEPSSLSARKQRLTPKSSTTEMQLQSSSKKSVEYDARFDDFNCISETRLITQRD
jgi:hypothetical protein